MAKASKNTVEVEGILSAVGGKLLDAVSIPSTAVLTWGEAYPNFESPVSNVGRDVEHTADAIASTAVSLLKNGQFVPLFTCPQDEYEHVLVDGERRLQAARLMVTGFDFQGVTYPPVESVELIVRSIVREDGENFTLEQVQALGRYFNTDRSMAGVMGPLSIGRTAASLKAANPGVSNRMIIQLLLGSGIKTDDSTVSRGLRLASLPKGMQDQILLGENSASAGIGYSALQPWIGKGIKQPNDAQWEAFAKKCTYTKKENEGKRNEREVTFQDFRGEVIAAWYGCNFDLEGTDDTPSPFAKWKPDGTRLPNVPKIKAPLTAEQLKLAEQKAAYAWKTFLAQTSQRLSKSQVPASVRRTAKEIVKIMDTMTWSANRSDILTAEEASKELVATLNRLAMDKVRIPADEAEATDSAS